MSGIATATFHHDVFHRYEEGCPICDQQRSQFKIVSVVTRDNIAVERASRLIVQRAYAEERWDTLSSKGKQ